jgi:hypothetical protein
MTARHVPATAKLPEPPSAGVLLDALLAERQARLESVDAMTNKAGILLGFTGAIVALTSLLGHWSLRVLVFVPATATVVYGLLALKTVLLPGLKPSGMRNELLMQPPLGAQLQMFDYFMTRHDQLVQTVADKAEYLGKTSVWLAITIGALALASLLEGIQ